jgi:NADPH:quinone reductase-like Zn-dependent oxidoreductase
MVQGRCDVWRTGTRRGNQVKAVVCRRYGPPDVLKLKEVAKPAPRDNEVLIKIRATTVTTTDCNMRNLTFVPRLMRLPVRLFMTGLFRPKVGTLGVDLAGEIETVAKDVRRFQVGDDVFGTPGDTAGAHAQYICLPEDGVLTRKPANVSWEQAATIPLAANTALFFLRDLGNVQTGQKVLINGASGGIGTFAVQLAKYYGAEVTGVCSTTNLDLVRSLEADKVIDYTQEDFTQRDETYDVIFDVVGKLSFSRCEHLLKEDGTYLVTIPTLDAIRNSDKVKLDGADPKVENLVFLRELVEEGVLKPVIDRVYPLEHIAEAFRYVEKGHKKGNVVITVDHDSA